ncbi:fatty-acyl-CoA synthase [Stella humosa]|uniref:Fatty-acyl-CoA synthase n=1 Tax=Stella humosa TaxID=94 RepID=A0A3N1KNY4_9PROT|nr:class I adenylate-forming enzyme family protein [Stella humosa]ROP81057.1 fatty-acyl-CoA synthase [Stella humosa]BBK29747.1 acyl-CoA synthetase [Stella humosa]
MTAAVEDGWLGYRVPEFARRKPDAPAIITPDETVPWGEFARRVLGAAADFHAQGVRPGTVAAILLRERPQDLVALFALQRLGAPTLCLDPAEPAAFSAAIAARAEARFLVADRDDPLPAGMTIIDMGAIRPQDAPILPPPPGLDMVSFISRSSGTTGGIPKLSTATFRLALERGRGMLERFPRGENDRYLKLTKISFAFGRNAATRALENGGAIIIPPPLRRATDLTDIVRRLGATWTVLTPVHLRDLARSGAPAPILPGVRILCSTAALSHAERQEIRERVSAGLHIGYGTNEVGGLTLAVPADLDERPASVGRALPGVDVEVVGPDGQAAPPELVGELRFRRPEFPREYVDPSPGASSRFAGGWYYPGDVGWLDADGYIYLKGRIDDVINVGGRKLYPADIEARLALHPAVADSAVVGLPVARRGMVAVAVVLLKQPCTPAELHAHCEAGLGPSRSPQEVLIAETLPRTALGKVDRWALAGVARMRLKDKGYG